MRQRSRDADLADAGGVRVVLFVWWMQMSDDGQQLPSASMLTRMGERLAALEARANSEIASLKGDTEAIRRLLHESNQTLTAFIGQQIAANSSAKADRELLDQHMKMCDRRGQILNRAAWTVVGTLFLILGYLLSHGLPWMLSHPSH